MQNQILVRRVVSDQRTLEKPMTELIRRIYLCEFERNLYKKEKTKDDEANMDELINIVNSLSVKYPVPTSLNLSNINEQISNSTQTADFIIAHYLSEEEEIDPALKLAYKKKVSRKLIPSINWDDYDNLFEETKIEIKEEKLKNEALGISEGDGEDDFGGDEDF